MLAARSREPGAGHVRRSSEGRRHGSLGPDDQARDRGRAHHRGARVTRATSSRPASTCTWATTSRCFGTRATPTSIPAASSRGSWSGSRHRPRSPSCCIRESSRWAPRSSVSGCRRTSSARLEGKSSLGRLGLLIHSTAGYVDPGWDGRLTLELSNVANLPILLAPGMRIGQISFSQMSTRWIAPTGIPSWAAATRASTRPRRARCSWTQTGIASGPWGSEGAS